MAYSHLYQNLKYKSVNKFTILILTLINFSVIQSSDSFNESTSEKNLFYIYKKLIDQIDTLFDSVRKSLQNQCLERQEKLTESDKTLWQVDYEKLKEETYNIMFQLFPHLKQLNDLIRANIKDIYEFIDYFVKHKIDIHAITKNLTNYQKLINDLEAFNQKYKYFDLTKHDINNLLVQPS